MKATITDIMRHDENIFVSFVCQSGSGIGVWRRNKNPQLRSYDVELDVAVRVRREMIIATACHPKMNRVNEVTSVCVAVEDVDNDGVAFLRLNESCFILADSDFTKEQVNTSISLSLSKQDLDVVPFGW